MLDAVVGGQLASAQGEEGGDDGDGSRRRLPAEPPAGAPTQRGAGRRGPGGHGEHAGILEGQPGLGQRALDQRDHCEGLAEAHEPTGAGQPVHAANAGLAAAGGVDRAVAATHGRGPMGRSVHEQAVAQRHATEAELGRRVRAHPSTRCARSRKKPAANPRSRTSIRSSAPWIRGAHSRIVMYFWGKKP